MPVFEYIALSAEGREKKGTIDADSIRSARQKLRSQGFFPTEVREGKETHAKASRDIRSWLPQDRVGTADLAIVTRQLSTLVGAGLPLVQALSALAEQIESGTLKRIIVDVREKVEEGGALHKALAIYPRAFPGLYVNMVAAGEASGSLDSVLENLANYLEASLELRRKVGGALMYPALMLVVCTLVVSVLLAFVVPKIVEIFVKQGATLPLPTRIIIGISHLILNWWWLIIVLIAGGVYLLRWYYKQPPGRKKIDSLLLRLPIYGPLFTKVMVARITRTLSTLLGSGVGLLTALDITKNIVGNSLVVTAIEEAREGVKEGRSLARELSKSGVFPTMLGHMVAVGEKSGELEKMLGKAGQAYESEVNAALSGVTKLIEPLMMIVVGGVVLAIVISVLLPMAEMISVVQK